nr:RHS repeat-associated core domain-containing protein [uncultured Pseudomonas sp.]
MPILRENPLCHYRYDALDRLIGNQLKSSPERQRFYCKSRLSTEIHDAIQHSIVQHGDQLLAQQLGQGKASDTLLLATDQQRSVLQTINATNQSHTIAYSPYGHRPAETGLTSLLSFNGESPDPVTGHYLLGNGYRAFNPVLMRFNTPDRLSPFGKGGLNAYAYCLGDPINWIDPNGAAPLSVWGKAIFTRKAKIGTYLGSPKDYDIKAGVSTIDAVKQHDRLVEIGDMIAQLEKKVQIDYQEAVKNPGMLLPMLDVSTADRQKNKAISYFLQRVSDQLSESPTRSSRLIIGNLTHLSRGNHKVPYVKPYHLLGEHLSKQYDAIKVRPLSNSIRDLDNERFDIMRKYFEY